MDLKKLIAARINTIRFRSSYNQQGYLDGELGLIFLSNSLHCGAPRWLLDFMSYVRFYSTIIKYSLF